jgi:hypothetical protein
LIGTRLLPLMRRESSSALRVFATQAHHLLRL